VSEEDKTPTNRYAATRPYCKKHWRAMLDIGGEKKCPTCRKEELKQAKEEAKP